MRSALVTFALCLVATSCGRTYRAGDEVMVEWEGKEYPALILTAAPDGKFKVHYDGYEDVWDENVAKSRVKGFKKGDEVRPEPPARGRAKAFEAAQSNTYRLGDQVRVLWSGKYYSRFSDAKTIADLISKGVAGSKPAIVCAEPEVVRDLRIDWKTGAILK